MTGSQTINVNGVFSEKIFQTCSNGVREVVILDGCKKKYAEVFWYLGTDII